ncbi:MAG TPA: class I SAM-dependent methyltransferase [Vicinamibacterales bacterium]|nr:class I SAM-dependent methyltransferase [Vicinamibacterales bacterium]
MASRVDELIFQHCLRTGRPYFGVVMAAGQGVRSRHGYMRRLVQYLIAQRPGRPFKVLEIGSWAGGSAITWARAIRDSGASGGTVVCVDPWVSYVNVDVNANRADENDVYVEMESALRRGEVVDLFRHNIRAGRVADLVVAIRGSSRDVLPRFFDGEFDLVYVDGDHVYESVKQDLTDAARLVAPGGALCGDDLEVQLSAVEPAYVRARMERELILDPATGCRFHGGVTLAVGEFFRCDVTSRDGFWAMQKSEDGWLWFEQVDFSGVQVPAHLRDFTPGFHYAAATTLMRLNRLDDAVTVLEAVLRARPEDAAARSKLAAVERRRCAVA